jgi:predicted DNA-binding transcriptional regulator YafY
MAQKEKYDKALTRLIGILTKLSNDERYNTKELALEYNVSERTIQKDIYQRLNYFPIVKDNDGYFIFEYGFTLNKSLLSSDEMMLVSLALSQFEDVSDFDKLTNSALQKLLSPSTFNPYFVKQDDIEDINIESNLIEELEESIRYQNHILIQGTRGDIEVEPYKIAAYDGIWYLVAKDEADQKTKTFMLSRIKKIKTLPNKHKVTQKYVEQLLDKTHSAWFEDGNCFEVVVKVYPQIAHYFKQKDFLQSQKVLEELDDGSLLVSFEVSHYEDIDNIIKAWIPDIEVIEPIEYKEKIKKDLEEYLKRIG